LLRFHRGVSAVPHASAVILTDQRTAAFRYAGWRPRAPEEAGGRHAQNEKPHGGFFRAGVERC
jgi:hypothetical protein